jgi:hypothetical protein
VENVIFGSIPAANVFNMQDVYAKYAGDVQPCLTLVKKANGVLAILKVWILTPAKKPWTRHLARAI